MFKKADDEEAKPGADGLECKDGCPEGSHCSGGVCFCNAGNFNVQLFLAFSYHRYWSVKGYPCFFIWLTYRIRIKFKAKYELIQKALVEEHNFSAEEIKLIIGQAEKQQKKKLKYKKRNTRNKK